MRTRKAFTIVELIVVVAILGIIGVILCSYGCGKESADRKMQIQTEQSLKEANAQIGMPAIINFQERKLAKMIFELRDSVDLITYAYIVNHMTGELVFIGKCIGFGLPYSVQYTSPMKFEDSPKIGTDWHVMPQADPNGLFMPSGLSATWLMMIDKDGEPRPVYVEPPIIVSPFPLK